MKWPWEQSAQERARWRGVNEFRWHTTASAKGYKEQQLLEREVDFGGSGRARWSAVCYDQAYYGATTREWVTRLVPESTPDTYKSHPELSERRTLVDVGIEEPDVTP